MIEIDNERTVFEKSKFKTDNEPTKYICELSEEEQFTVKAIIVSALCYELNVNSKDFEEALTNGMNGRLCDLEELIVIEYIKEEL